MPPRNGRSSESSNIQIPDAAAILATLRSDTDSLRNQYFSDPIGLAESFHLKLPLKPVQRMLELGVITEEEALDRFGVLEPGIRDLIYDVCIGDVRSAGAVANRGGGKSLGVSFIEFFLVFIRKYDALNLGGSELQADQVYQYLLSYIESDPYWQSLVKGEPMRERTYTVDEAWIRVLTASQKSVRSPHAGGRKKDGRMAGGLLVIDEEAEAAPEIVEAALPTVNTARPSVVVRASTFHNAEGTFAELVDNAEEMGFKMYKWDIFDVAEACDCTGGACQAEEKCFREDHVEKFTDPETGVETERLVHKAYCGGRAQYADGWVPLEEITALWKRMKRNHSRWEVEAMGSRPSSAGHVLKDLGAFINNVQSISAAELFKPGMPITICVDWGSSNAGVTVWQEQWPNNHALLHADLIIEGSLTQILGVIQAYWTRYFNEATEVAADIGGGGSYNNPHLRDEMGIPTRDVNFATEKEAAVAAWNIYNDAGRCHYPDEFTDFVAQAKNWKRKGGRIQKGNDHLMDSSVCYFAKFVESLGIATVRVVPRTFGTEPQQSGHQIVNARSINSGSGTRVAMIRSIGNRNRR